MPGASCTPAARRNPIFGGSLRISSGFQRAVADHSTRPKGILVLPANHSFIRQIVSVLVATLVLGSGAVATADTPVTVGTMLIAEYSSSASALVLRLTRRIGMLRESEPSEQISVYGDGHVVVDRAAYRKDGGTFELILTKPELGELLADVLAGGVADFDAEQARQDRKSAARAASAQALRAGTEIHWSSDGEWTEIDVNLMRYRGTAAGAVWHDDVRKRATWHGLRGDVKSHPELEALQGLAQAEERIAALASRSDLREVR